jgi:hypothetical protein
VQNRADEPVCWDGSPELFEGMVSATAANDSERLLAAGTP